MRRSIEVAALRVFWHVSFFRVWGAPSWLQDANQLVLMALPLPPLYPDVLWRRILTLSPGQRFMLAVEVGAECVCVGVCKSRVASVHDSKTEFGCSS